MNTLDLSSTGISSLKTGDFNGLTDLMELNLNSNDLSELPPNIFAGLTNLQSLNLSSNAFSTLLANIFADLTSLQTLLLNDNNELETLPMNIFDGLTNLLTLDLSSNAFSTLPAKIFTGLTNLVSLDLSFSGLSELPANIFADLTSLETLLLNDNDLVTLPANIFAGLISLQNFSIDNNPDDDKFRLELTLNRTVVPDEAPGPAFLELELVEGAPTMISAQILINGDPADPAIELILLVGATVSNTIEISDTGPGKVTVTIGTLTTPTSTVDLGIEFVRNALELFPTPVCDRTTQVANAIVEASPADSCDAVTTTQLADITTLDLSGDDSSSEITSLMSGDFDGLAGLTKLDLSDNSLTTLPETIFNSLTALSNLDLSFNAFSTLSETIFSELTNLETLLLNDNGLVTLPTNIFVGLTNLLTLDLSSNTFNTLSATIFSGLDSLETLRLNDNGLETLPTDIFVGLTSLLTLDLSSNGFNDLETLPPNIFAGLTNLLTLDLSSNDFRTLSVIIFSELTSLETLRLNDNDLVTLPTNIFSKLTSLETLLLNNNDLVTLSMNIFASFTNLQTLDMSDNPEPGKDYMFNLSLNRVPVGNYAPSPASLSLQIAEGVPTTLTFPIRVTGTATVTDNAGNNITELTLTVGSTESDMFRVISADVVAVGFDPVMMLPTSFTGVQFVLSDVLFLFSTVCDRTTQVANAIVALALVETCDEVTAGHLAEIRRLDLIGISSLQTGDFAGLTNLEYLDLSSNNLSELPENIFAGRTNLVELDLSSSGLSELPPNVFAGLTSLETLRLNGNDLETLPADIFDGPTNLLTLDLSSNAFSTLPADIFAGLTKLLMLDLSSNAFNTNTLPENIFAGLTNLLMLDLSSNAFNTLPENIFAGLTNLVSLDLSFSGLSELPANIFAGLTNLVSLDLSFSGLSELPANIFAGPTNLLMLDLTFNTFSTLPANIFAGLTKLETLLLNDNDLVTLPPNTFTGLIRLETFSIDNNPDNNEFQLELTLNRTVVPDEVPGPADLVLELVEGAPTTISAQILLDGSHVTELRLAVGATVSNTIEIAARSRKVTMTIGTVTTTPTSTVEHGIEFVSNTLELFSIPVCDRTPAVADAIVALAPVATCSEVTTVHLADITTLDLSSTGINSLKTDDFDNLVALQTLNLASNELNDLPEDIFADLTNLLTLDLSFNDFNILSETIFSELTRLETLRLNNNRLVTLPPNIFADLTNLLTLDLSSNTFSTLPENIFADLTDLLTLNLASNGLNDLPEDIFNSLTALRNLEMSSNTFSTLPANIFVGLTDLLTLNLASNGLNDLPEDIFNSLTALSNLDLSSNDFNTLSVIIFSELTSLETLRLNGNDLETLPMNIFAGPTNLLTLDLSSNNFNTLLATIFSELTSLETLLLNGNNLVTLPPNIFAGLTNLQTLNMEDNLYTGDNYMFNLSLSRVDGINYEPSPASLSLQIAEGAPTTLTFPIIVTGTATVTDNARNNITELTFTAGSTESDVFHVISAESVVVGLDPAMPTSFTGVQFVVSDVLFLFSTVCDRTTVVEIEILSLVPATTCDKVTTAHLALIKTLDLRGISSLQTGDFAGLTNLMSLDLSLSGSLSELPANVFAGLTNLVSLDLSFSGLSELPAPNIFAGLINLETLLLNDNNLGTLPPNTFAGLIRLETFSIDNNPNTGDEFRLELTLNRTDKPDEALGPAFLVLELVEGAPAMITAQILVTGGTTTVTDTEGNLATELTLAVGSTVSNTIRVSNTGSEKVTVTIGTVTTTPTSTVEHGIEFVRNALELFPTPVCDRTTQVADAIVAAVSEVSTAVSIACGDVTAGHLADITTLDLSSTGISSLKTGDFDNLIALQTLNLASNGLNNLPEDIFNSLTALRELDLSSNDFSTLPLNIFAGLTNLLTLDLSSNAFNNTLPATIFSELTSLETLLLNDNDLVTLPPNIFAGLTSLQALNMVNNPDTGDNYMFNLSLNRVNVENYAPSPASLSLQIAEGAPTALTFPIRVTGTATVTDIADNNITELTLAAGSIESDEFHVISADVVAVGLGPVMMLPTSFTGVQFDVSDVLFLFSTVCGRTPQVANAIVEAVFDATSCDEVTAGHLAEIRTLDLSGISSLKTGDFDGLTNLMSLDLSSGSLSELPTNIFADLTNLETLLLNGNDLETLPPNIFAGLTGLNMLNLSDNPDAGDSYTFILELTRTDGFNDDAPSPAMVSLRLNEGAPTKLSFSLATDNITISNTEVMTINAGSTESNTVRIERTGGTEKIMLGISRVVLGFPDQFIGMDLDTDDVLLLFPIPTVPVTPTVVVNPGNGQLTVSWNVSNDGNSPIKSFTVFVNRPGEDPSSTTVDASMSPYTIMSLSNDIEYSIRVVVTNDVGDSPSSDPIRATPTPPSSFRFRIKVFLEGAL